MNNRDRLPIVLSIAGSDNTGGAGIQADIKTCCAYHTYAATVITAVTAQNCNGVKSVQYVGDEMLKLQLDATFEMFIPNAVKIGMIPCASAVEIIANSLKAHNIKNIVIDPVLGATSGGSLSGETAETAREISDKIFPIATIVTPNVPEAEFFNSLLKNSTCYLSESEVHKMDIKEVGASLINTYKIKNLLIKGGHISGDGNMVVDTLFTKNSRDISTTTFVAEKVESNHTHGTGCALSSAIACGLANGYPLNISIDKAKAFIHSAIKNGVRYPIVRDNGPIYLFNE